MSEDVKIEDLFASAHEEGDLSAESLQALSVDADIGARIQAGLGILPQDVPASEVLLVSMMPDDSGSIQSAHNEEAVRSGHNVVLEALRKSSAREDVLVHTRYLNGTVLFPYRPLREALDMNRQNYQANQGTPLFDQTVVLLGTVLAKHRQLELAGVPARTVTLLITDGADMHSTRQTARSVRSVVSDMLRSEAHVIAAMGISDGTTDFRRVFEEMGIPDRWILTPAGTQSEIRKAFCVFSQSAVRLSQGAGSFGQAALGGFGN